MKIMIDWELEKYNCLKPILYAYDRMNSNWWFGKSFFYKMKCFISYINYYPKLIKFQEDITQKSLEYYNEDSDLKEGREVEVLINTDKGLKTIVRKI